jgi:RNA polymerase sigma-70 factor (ECF subfamily)
MSASALPEVPQSPAPSDEEVVARVLGGDTAAFELLMRRHNQKLYRVARAILREDGEAEDVMQDAYVRAYEHLDQFAGRAKFSTWLTRIAVHEALARLRRRNRTDALESIIETTGETMTFASHAPNPEQEAVEAQNRSLLEAAILELPDGYRTVLMLRDIEELDTAETAEILGLTEENVKVRLHRARTLLRRELYTRVGDTRTAAFSFMGERCDRVVLGVLRKIGRGTAETQHSN